MSRTPNKDEKMLYNTAVALTSLCINRVMQNQAQEMKLEEERRAKIMRHKLQEKKSALVERLISAVSTAGSTPQLEALLAQILNAPLEDIPIYERNVNDLGIIDHSRSFLLQSSRHRTPTIHPVFPPIESMLLSNVFSNLIITGGSNEPVETKRPEVNEGEKKVCVSFKNLQREVNNSTCTICLDKYEPDDEVEIRHCGHTFHKKCLTSWEESGRSQGKLCPCCRH